MSNSYGVVMTYAVEQKKRKEKNPKNYMNVAQNSSKSPIFAFT